MPEVWDKVLVLPIIGTLDSARTQVVMESLLQRIVETSSEVAIIDITHDVPRHDVRAGGLALARSAQYLAPGVVLAVVDPGVGTDRRAIAVEVGDGASILVGPDNGLLASAVAMVGGATRVVDLRGREGHPGERVAAGAQPRVHDSAEAAHHCGAGRP